MIEDRIIRGLIAGVVGAMVQDVYAYFCRVIGWTNVVYLDVAKAVLFNNHYSSELATLVAFLGQLSIDGCWGIIYVYLIKNTSNRYFWIKGPFLGCGIWFLVRVIWTKWLPIPELGDNPPKVALFFFTGALLFGFILALTSWLLDSKKR